MTQMVQDRVKTRPSPLPTAGAAPKLELTMSIKPELLEMLEEMASESHQSLEAVFTTAIALYRASLNALAEGKHIGYASSPESLEVEFTGFIASGDE